MEDVKKKINFDSSLLYYSPTSKEGEEDEKPSVTNVETYNSTNRKHVCTVCGKRFFSTSALNLHMEHHPPNERNERSNVEKDDDNCSISRKNQYVWDKGIKCNKLQCNFIALDAVEYSKHISSCEGTRMNKGEENIPFCDLCDSYFSSENHIKAHSILQHPNCDPDISLQECDAKHTTLSDPVSLYVLENNLENEADVKQTKNLVYSKYPDSSVLKKKSKEVENEDSSSKKENTDKIMEEVTINSETPKTCETDSVSSKDERMVDINKENPTTDNSVNSELFTKNDVCSQRENGKSEPTEEIISQTNLENESKNEASTEPNVSPLKPCENVTDTKVKNKAESIKAKDSVLSSDKDSVVASGEEMTEDKTELCSDSVSTEKEDNVVVELKSNGVTENARDQQMINTVKNSSDTEAVVVDSKKVDSENGQVKKEVKHQERYMNVEKMMFNLFNEERAAGVLTNLKQETAQDSQNTSCQETKEEDETNQKRDEVDIKKEDSDFEEFDYNRAGKKKYLKSYGRLNKNAGNSCDDEKFEKISEVIEDAKQNESTGLNTKTQRKRSYERKSLAEKTVDSQNIDTSSDSIIKERSTRTRKKLILPDFEYDSDYKDYGSNVTSKRTEVSKRPSLSKSNDSTPKKRGRPRKNPDNNQSRASFADESDISSSSISKASTDIKEKIEGSYLNASEAAVKHSSTVDSIDLSSNSALSDSFSQNEITGNDEYSAETIIERSTDSTATVKKKRGRPPKVKREFKRLNKLPKPALSTSTVDQTTEESIYSDVANALLSLGDSVAVNPPKEMPMEKFTSTSIPSKVEQVHIIKRKKMKMVKSIDPLNVRKDDIERISTFELKNVENDTTDASSEIDDNLSFNDANKFEKEKISDGTEISFMKDMPLTTNVSTPKKRGRPPKERKEDSSYSVPPQKPLVSEIISKPKPIQLSTPEERKKSKLLDDKLSNRKSVFLKKKAKMKRDHQERLKSLSLSRKKGRPFKTLKEDVKNPPSALDHSATNEVKPIVADGDHVEKQIDVLMAEKSDSSSITKQNLKTTDVPKRKKGRPPKSAQISGSGTEAREKDLNLNELKNSHKGREDSPFIYENYHPKKKRSRIDSSSQKDSGDDASQSKSEEYIAPKKVPRITKPKASAVEYNDETRIIDEELYTEDVKNRTKYGKLFKKPKQFVYDEKFTDDMMINCGRCKKKMTFRHYKTYHQISHYYITWIDGEPEIDLNEDSEVVRSLQSAITPDALRKKAIRLACEKCGDVRKSVVGYVSHVRFCQKEDKDDLFETCELCGRTLRPSSVRFHYIKFHGTYKTTKGGMAYSSSSILDSSQDMQEDSDDGGVHTPIGERLRERYTKEVLEKKDIVDDEEFWTVLKTSCDILYMCMGWDCRHMTISKEDLKAHILECDKKFYEYRCISCTYKTKYKNEIIYHSKKKCRDNSDDEQKPENSEVVRRVSTRKKTRKFKYDNLTEFNETSDDDKNNADGDFEIGNDAGSDDLDDDDDFDEESDRDLSTRKPPSKRKKVERQITKTNVSDKLGLRNAFQQYCLGRLDPLRWTVDLRLKLFSSTPLHVHMKVNTKEWEMLSLPDTEKYIPFHQKSVKAYFDSAPPSQFDLFQADVIKGTPICFVGGPVWAMAWAPLPAQVTEQYLAVSTLQHMNHLVEINDSVSFSSLIQLWKFNSIDNISNDIQTPVLAWSIAHCHGAIWSMEWCPSGGFNNLSPTCRLGILAAATSAGYVAIYNVPKLDINDVIAEPKDAITNPRPDLILKTRSNNVQCTRVVWDHMSPHNSLIGGFSDGVIAFWNINTASMLLKKGSVLYPYRTFEAHNTPITALDLHWLNSSRFLLTGSTDRTTRYWDLNDLSGPINEYERTTPVMNAVWMQHWIVTANVHDFGSLIGESSAFIAHPRDPFEKKKTLINIRDAFWSVSYSLWNDTVAVSSNGGYVSLYAAKHLSLLSYKQPDFEKIITSTQLVDLNDEEKKEFSVDGLTTKMPSTNDLFDCTTVIQNNGIRFSDKAKSKASNEVISFDVEKCSPTSVNKVCWNQNYNSFNWLAIGYECGFVRVIRVERFDKHYLTKFYKTNENTATLM